MYLHLLQLSNGRLAVINERKSLVSRPQSEGIAAAKSRRPRSGCLRLDAAGGKLSQGLREPNCRSSWASLGVILHLFPEPFYPYLGVFIPALHQMVEGHMTPRRVEQLLDRL
ncbi:MAG: hypothetical protein M3P18_00415 [Actinomycetota bacterium]|nr:hypothetical protein [Actinomycetota bacterium]